MERGTAQLRAKTSGNPDDGFRSFVAAVSEPLTRLAYVLTVEVSGQPAAGLLAASALAQVRREWREVEGPGLPEQLAVDALLSAVVKRHHRVPWLGRGTRAPAEVPAIPLAGPNAGRLAAETVDATESSADLEQQLLRDATWRAFLRLSPPERAAFVFADPSVAAVRFAGLEVPPSLGSSRRQHVVAAAAIEGLRAALRADPAVNGERATRTGLDALADEHLVLLAGDAIRAHAPSAPSVFDPNSEVGTRVAHLHRRALLAGALVVVLIAAAGGWAVIVSTPNAAAPRAAATAATAVAASSGPVPLVAPVAVQPPIDPDEPVLPWPVRGSLRDDTSLLARVEAAFSQAHPDATSQPQVLLITDTPAFRIAYVTATTSTGVLQSWFSGPPGSADLVESAFSRGDVIEPTTVIAARLHQASAADGAGAASPSTTALVVIAPPTASIRVLDTAGSAPPAVAASPASDGTDVVAVGAQAAATLLVHVRFATDPANADNIAFVDDVELDASKSYPTGIAQAEQLPPVPAVTVERGRPDPALLADALLVAQARAWALPDGAPASAPVVLWGGSDTVGTKLVVARVHSIPFDLLVLEWSGDTAGLHGEVLVRSTSPEVPVAFAYRSAQGTRIGIISEPTDKAAALEFGGSVSPVAMFDSDGFASIPLSGPGGLPGDVNVNASPPPSNDFAGSIDATVQVELFGWDDQVRGLLDVPPAL